MSPLLSELGAKYQELQAKAQLIDYILEGASADTIIATEVWFAAFKRKADILTVSNSLEAYEVKTATDNLDKFSEQIEDYVSCFPCVWAAVAPNHMEAVRKYSPKSVGILEITENGIFKRREPIIRRRLKKDYLVSFLDTPHMLRIAPQLRGISKSPSTGVDALRTKLKKEGKTQIILQAAIEALRSKYRDSFYSFINNRGTVTHVEDLRLLRPIPNMLSR